MLKRNIGLTHKLQDQFVELIMKKYKLTYAGVIKVFVLYFDEIIGPRNGSEKSVYDDAVEQDLIHKLIQRLQVYSHANL